MARALTTQELDTVSGKRKDNRPEFFFDAKDQHEVISVDMETWCLLHPELAKILELLETEQKDKLNRKGRTELFEEFTDDAVSALVGEEREGENLKTPYDQGRVGQLLKIVEKIEEGVAAIGPTQDTKAGTRMEGLEGAVEAQLISSDIELPLDEVYSRFIESLFTAEWLWYTNRKRWVFHGSIHTKRSQRIQSWREVLGVYA